jgi:hypothetical protein
VEKRLTCECGHELTVRPESTATSLDCPACGRELTIPPTPAEPAPGAPPEAAPPGDQGDSREPCPFCLEFLLPGARKCPFCQEYLDPAIARASQARAPAPAPPQTRTSGIAVASLALAVAAPFLCFVTAPPAVLLGLGGILATGRKVRGRAMAVAGLLLGLLWTALVIGLLVLVSQAGGGLPVDVGDPRNPYLF